MPRKRVKDVDRIAEQEPHPSSILAVSTMSGRGVDREEELGAWRPPKASARAALAAALAQGVPLGEAMRASGLGARDLAHLRQDPRWMAKLARAAEQEASPEAAIERAKAAIGRATERAAAVLEGLLDSEADTVRLKAATEILELGLAHRSTDHRHLHVHVADAVARLEAPRED